MYPEAENNTVDPKKLEELRKAMLLKKMLLRKGMSAEARERLGRIRLANPELAAKVEAVAIQLISQGKYIDDALLRKILEKFAEKKRRFRIMRW